MWKGLLEDYRGGVSGVGERVNWRMWLYRRGPMSDYWQISRKYLSVLNTKHFDLSFIFWGSQKFFKTVSYRTPQGETGHEVCLAWALTFSLALGNQDSSALMTNSFYILDFLARLLLDERCHGEIDLNKSKVKTTKKRCARQGETMDPFEVLFLESWFDCAQSDGWEWGEWLEPKAKQEACGCSLDFSSCFRMTRIGFAGGQGRGRCKMHCRGVIIRTWIRGWV